VIEPLADTFVVGSPRSEPGHQSALERQFRVPVPARFGLSTTEVTELQYWAVIDPNHEVHERRQDHPVTDVTYEEAVEFCRALQEKHSGKRYRLPTEVEWEYACREGTTGMYAVWKHAKVSLEEATEGWRDESRLTLKYHTPQLFHFDASGTKKVGSYGANGLGLHDMHGNAWEWCAAPTQDDPNVPHAHISVSPLEKAIRGGAWNSTSFLECRSAQRYWVDKDTKTGAIGFRVLCENPD